MPQATGAAALWLLLISRDHIIDKGRYRARDALEEAAAFVCHTLTMSVGARVLATLNPARHAWQPKRGRAWLRAPSGPARGAGGLTCAARPGHAEGVGTKGVPSLHHSPR
jgi:hypothetical protein